MESNIHGMFGTHATRFSLITRSSLKELCSTPEHQISLISGFNAMAILETRQIISQIGASERKLCNLITTGLENY